MISQNVKWHLSKVSLPEIEERNNHKGCVIWLTGLSASGKSTIAVVLERITKQALDSQYLFFEN